MGRATDDASRPGIGRLSEEMLTFEPPKMVNMRTSPGSSCNEHDPSGLMAMNGETKTMARLRVLELSNVDQMYDYYMRVALFYDVVKFNSEVANGSSTVGDHAENGPARRLEVALEELLVHYPAAGGRLCYNEAEGRLEIQYYDAPPIAAGGKLVDGGDYEFDTGVKFITAHANVAFKEIGDPSVANPSLDLLYPSPCLSAIFPGKNGSFSGNYVPRPVTIIQVTTFTCGGFCLSHLAHHTLLDGFGGGAFLQNLCSIARGKGLSIHPEFSVSRRQIFQPRTPPSPSLDVIRLASIRFHPDGQFIEALGSSQEQLPSGTATTIAFPYTALERLRHRASNFATDRKHLCSRYQALVGLLWIARAKSLRAGSNTVTQDLELRFPMNLRDKGIMGLNRHYPGNAVFQLAIRATVLELCELPLHEVVNKLRSVMGSVNFAECAQSLTDYIETKMKEGLTPDIDRPCLAIVALFGLPFYDADCGWGRPCFFGLPSKQLAARISILDNPSAAAWNALVVFNSEEERAAFMKEIADYILT
ncbi:hypothetical protein KP509_1Z036900 [Ceratopteris richardii]|nr:hypothetical protein KP509_1Z036900 [Ceratopteris richardii]